MRESFRPTLAALHRPWLHLLALGLSVAAWARPVRFDIPAQSAASALLAFSEQSGLEVLFNYDELAKVRSLSVAGEMEPLDAMTRLLRNTGFTARRNGNGKITITLSSLSAGSIRGRILASDGSPLAGLQVSASGRLLTAVTDAQGVFTLTGLSPGSWTLLAVGPGYRTLQVTGVAVTSGNLTRLETQTMQSADETTRLEPYIVSGRSADLRPFDHSQTLDTPIRAGGNLDLPRSENGALPYTIYDRDQLARSGVVDLNDFLQRELLEGDAATRPPGSVSSVAEIISGSTNLNLRGFGTDETVILVNGRRLPEMLTSGSSYHPPDVNLIPLSMVQQIEVLPVSASSLYAGNAVGGVINIVLRPEADTDSTEVNSTYTNSLDGHDAPQSSLSLLHSRSLLSGRLRLRLSLTHSWAEPPTEAELGYRQARPEAMVLPWEPLYRATPNVRSPDGLPLFGPGSASVTSVAPGADGSGGLPAFLGRQGARNSGWFESPSSLSVSSASLDYPYGLRQRRTAGAGSVVYDLTPWLQLGADGVSSRTVINRGADVFRGDLRLAAANPINPFGHDVNISLNETAPALGDKYSEALVSFTSLVLGVLLKPASDWRIVLDAQYASNVVRYRGLYGIDPGRWQSLVDRGLYNPLRDTQAYGPPRVFYDEVLRYLGGRDRFVTVGNYDTLDGAIRLTNQNLPLPTGTGVVNAGADYRRSHLGNYTEEVRYSDNSLAQPASPWSGRTLERYSLFGELQAPALPGRWLPAWTRTLDVDLALRYVAAASAKESNLAPTVGLKLETPWGLSFRTSFTTSSRVPTPQMSGLVAGRGSGPAATYKTIYDPLRAQSYDVLVSEQTATALLAEDSVTQTAGVVFLRGRTHRVRAALDFVDTQKSNEVVVFDAQDIINLESVLPGGRVRRATSGPGGVTAPGPVTEVFTGPLNTDRRHSQNWNASLDYSWTKCLGGILAFRGRLLWYSRYERRLFPTSPTRDELGQPDTNAASVIKYRANLAANWSNSRGGFGLEGHYFHSRVLPAAEWASQGRDRIRPYWQCDAYLQGDIGRWLPASLERHGLRAQVRVNNLFATPYPKYANEGSGAGVQPYGDWRGRVYSLSLTASF